MSDSPKPKNVSDGNEAAWFGAVAGGLMLVVLFVPLVLGAAGYMATRRYTRMSRREYVILFVGAFVATLVGSVGGGRLVADYLSWVGVLVFGGDRWSVPLVSLVTLSALVCALAGAVMDSPLSAKLPKLLKRNRLDDRPHVIPTARERERVKIAAPPVLTVDPSAHSVTSNAGEDAGPRSFPVGVDEKGRPVMITEQEIGLHGLIFGATGSGKSETLKVIAAGLLDLGWAGLILDLKEDIGLRNWCAEYASHHSLPYQELRLSSREGDFWFDPLGGLGQDEARDTILSLTRFDDEHWQNVNKRMLGQLIKLMFWAHQIDPASVPAPTMYEVGKILSAPKLVQATKKMRALVVANRPDVNENEEFGSMVNPTQDETKSATGFGAKITQIYDTAAGAITLRPTGNRRPLDVTQGGLIYVGLDSQGKKDLTRAVSSAVLQRLSVEAAMRATGNAEGKTFKKFVIVDEANWVDRTITQNLLSRARSAGIAMLLSTQGPKDWIDRDGDDFAKLSQNTNVAMIMRQGEPDSAEMCADYIGKTEFMATSYSHADGSMLNAGSTRREVDHLVSPDDLRRLEIGEMVVRVGAPQERITYAKVIRRDPSVIAGPGHVAPRGALGPGTFRR